MARIAGMRVLAEGCETIDQIAALHRDGCDAFQGFWFGRPVPPAQAEQMLKQRDLGERVRTALAEIPVTHDS